MKTVCVLQHVEAEYLGLIEDHLEARSIRFRYCRPFVPGSRIPASADDFAGLIILGAGPLGMVSGPLLPSLAAEMRLTGDFLSRSLPVIGIGLGAAILATVAGGGAVEAPLRFTVGTARRCRPGALGGHLPEEVPAAVYMRDRPVLPPDAETLATDEAGEPAVFHIGERGYGFLGHPGIKSAMIEDLIMATDDIPDGTAEGLERLRFLQPEIAEALTGIMVGLVRMSDWMTPDA